MPRGFGVEVKTAETGEKSFTIDYAVEAARSAVEEPRGAGRVVVVKGKTTQAEYPLEKARTNIGRIAELTDAEQRVVRRNDVVFEEGDEANATVSRRHAHIRLEAGEYRICDDESEFGTRVFREGRAIEVPAGNRRGERLRPGDEIYLGRACLRFER
jgi:pSer/pThr/pTyr-binding forkhead associated (FHA) protein